MSDSTNKTILVAGGTGGVGEGVVRAFLRAGATVLVPYRDDAKAERLMDYCADESTAPGVMRYSDRPGESTRGQLVMLAGHLGDESEGNQLQERIQREFGPLDLVVASLGGWWQGTPLVGIDRDTWNTVIQNNLTTHFAAIRHFVPLLNPNSGVYVHINGMAAEQVVPMASLVGVCAAAQKAMVLSLADEFSRKPVRIYELLLGIVNTRDRRQYGYDTPDGLVPETIGDYILNLYADGPTEVLHRLLTNDQLLVRPQR